MIQLTIKKGSEKVIAQLPSKWEEVTVKQFLALETGSTDLEILSGLADVDLSILENTETDLSPALSKVAEFLNGARLDFKVLPKQPVHLLGKSISFPKSIEFTKYGQKSMLKSYLRNHEPNKIISECFAIYAQPYIDGSFISERVPEVKKAVDLLPIVRVFAWVVFFLRRLIVLKNSLPPL